MENQNEFQKFLTTDGNDLVIAFNSESEKASNKAQMIQPLVLEYFNNFLKEVASLSDKVPMKHKVKVILFVE